jgi:hypothetical protein
MTSQQRGVRLVSVPEAAAELGVTEADIRKMIREGRLKAEYVIRPGGSSYLVTIAGDVSAALGSEAFEGLSTILTEEMLTSALSPFLMELTASRQVASDQFERMAQLSRENGRPTAERDHLVAERDRLAIETEHMRAEIAKLRRQAAELRVMVMKRASAAVLATICTIGAGVWARKMVRRTR